MLGQQASALLYALVVDSGVEILREAGGKFRLTTIQLQHSSAELGLHQAAFNDGGGNSLCCGALLQISNTAFKFCRRQCLSPLAQTTEQNETDKPLPPKDHTYSNIGVSLCGQQHNQFRQEKELSPSGQKQKCEFCPLLARIRADPSSPP